MKIKKVLIIGIILVYYMVSVNSDNLGAFEKIECNDICGDGYFGSIFFEGMCWEHENETFIYYTPSGAKEWTHNSAGDNSCQEYLGNPDLKCYCAEDLEMVPEDLCRTEYSSCVSDQECCNENCVNGFCKPEDESIDCSIYESCEECTVLNLCGWCSDTNECKPGTSEGPYDLSCEANYWIKSDSCPQNANSQDEEEPEEIDTENYNIWFYLFLGFLITSLIIWVYFKLRKQKPISITDYQNSELMITNVFV